MHRGKAFTFVCVPLCPSYPEGVCTGTDARQIRSPVPPTLPPSLPPKGVRVILPSVSEGERVNKGGKVEGKQRGTYLLRR